jgi:hypothetical protein
VASPDNNTAVCALVRRAPDETDPTRYSADRSEREAQGGVRFDFVRETLGVPALDVNKVGDPQPPSTTAQLSMGILTLRTQTSYM